jgi:hypothetical protein
VATYVCTTDDTRTRQYPFAEGARIPHDTTFEGLTYTLRAIVYHVDRAAA